MKKGIGISTIWIMSKERTNYSKFDSGYQYHLEFVKCKINHLLFLYINLDQYFCMLMY